MFELAVATFRVNQIPAVTLDQPDNIFDLHKGIVLDCLPKVNRQILLKTVGGIDFGVGLDNKVRFALRSFKSYNSAQPNQSK